MRGQNPSHCSSLFPLCRGEFSNTELLSSRKASAMLIADVLYSCHPFPIFFGGKLLLAVPWQLWIWQTANHLLVLHAYSSQGCILLPGENGEPEQTYLTAMESAGDTPVGAVGLC